MNDEPCEISDDAIAVITRALAEQTAAYPALHRVVVDTIQNLRQLRHQRDEARARLPAEERKTPLDEILAKLESNHTHVPADVPISQSLIDALSNDETSDETPDEEIVPKTGPCENENCDACYPIPHWRVSEHRVQHVTHTREIKAATSEEALAIYNQGTAWPSSYDDRHGKIIQLDPIVVEKIEDERILPADWQCWHKL